MFDLWWLLGDDCKLPTEVQAQGLSEVVDLSRRPIGCSVSNTTRAEPKGSVVELRSYSHLWSHLLYAASFLQSHLALDDLLLLHLGFRVTLWSCPTEWRTQGRPWHLPEKRRWLGNTTNAPYWLNTVCMMALHFWDIWYLWWFVWSSVTSSFARIMDPNIKPMWVKCKQENVWVPYLSWTSTKEQVDTSPGRVHMITDIEP